MYYYEEQEMPTCPVCGNDCNDYYLNDGEIVGCDQCINVVSAYEKAEEDKLNAQIDRAEYMRD